MRLNSLSLKLIYGKILVGETQFIFQADDRFSGRKESLVS